MPRWAGPVHPERHRYLANAGSAVEGAHGYPQASGPVGSGQSRLGASGFEGCLWRLLRRAVPAGGGGCHPLARCGFPLGITHPGFLPVADYASGTLRRRQTMNRLYAVERCRRDRLQGRPPAGAEGEPRWSACAQAAGEWSSWAVAGEEHGKFIAALAPTSIRAAASAWSSRASSSRRRCTLRRSLNQALGKVGKTVVYTETVQPLPRQLDDLKSLVADMNARQGKWL